MGNSEEPHSRPWSNFWFVTAAFILIITLTGCVTLKDPEGSQIHSAAIVGTVDSQDTFSQSFVSRRTQLNGIELWLTHAPESPEQNGTLYAELYHNPPEAEPLIVVPISFNDIAQNSPVYVPFPAQKGPPGQDYYLSLKTKTGSLQVHGRDEETFPDGTAFQNGIPLEADAAFRLSYDYGLGGVLSDLQRFILDAWLILPLALVLIVPGWVLLNLSGAEIGFDSGERVALSVGLSLAIIPVLMTWTSFLGLAWGRVSVLFTAGLISALVIWRLWSRRAWQALKFDWYGLALLGIFILTLAVRLIMVRDLFAPPWVDSVHHGVITRLILEMGGFPGTYAPYLDIDSANYHPGFHSLLASFQWLSNLELHSGMLVLGQVLNALVVFAVYLITVTLTRNRTAGIFAALISGLITPMPAYYTSWGRYTQLAGLLILPTAFVLLKRTSYPYRSSAQDGVNLSRTGRLSSQIAGKWKFLILAGIAIGGLFLTHYRVAAFLGCLVLADFFSHIWPQLKKGATKKDLLREIALILVAGGMAFTLVVPWLLPTFTSLLIPKFITWRGGNAPLFEGFSWIFLNSALGQYALVLSGLGLLWGLFKRQWFTLTLILWVVILFTLANLAHFGLPGGVFINNLSVEITLFIPIAILGGYLVNEVVLTGGRVIPTPWVRWYSWGVGVIAVVIGLIGARHLVPLLNPVTFLSRQADFAALTWLEENVPEGETVLINPFAWGYNVYAGNDGGYWASPLSAHKTMPPPVLYGLSNTREDVQSTSEFSQKVIDNGDNAEALYTLMREQGIQYVYTGARGGAISPRALQDSHLFESLYAQDGTWVFRVIRNF